MNNASKINNVLDTSLLDDGIENLSPLPYVNNSNLGKMKYSLPNHNSTLDKDILSKFLKYDNSPGQHTKSHNTTEDIALSLGLEHNESVGWTSALETPHIGDGNGKKKKTVSTVERLTLHSTRELRQSVLARALFSPLFDNKEKCSKSLISNVLSPLAKNLENGASCQKNIDVSKNITLEFDEPVKPVIDDTSLNHTKEKELFTETPLCDNMKFTSGAMTSTPISVEKSKYKYTNHLRKCLDDTFKKISPDAVSKIHNLVRRNINESSYAIEEFYNISPENTAQNMNDKESLNVNANSNSVTFREANISELSLDYLCSQKSHLELSSFSNDNSKFKSKLSLKRKKSSKFIYPIPDENLHYENDPNKNLCNLEKISEPIANKFLRQQCNFNSLLQINCSNHVNMMGKKSGVADTCKMANPMENETNNLFKEESKQIVANLSPSHNVDKNLGLPKFTATEGSKEKSNIESKQDSSFLSYNSQTEKGINKLNIETDMLANSENKESPKCKDKESTSKNEKVSLVPDSLISCQDIFQNRLEEPEVALKVSSSECDNGNVAEAFSSSKHPDKFIGFLNGSCKKVGVSDASLKKIHNISDEQHHPNKDSNQTVLATVHTPLFQPFMDCNSRDVSLNASDILGMNNESNQIGDVWNRPAKISVNGLCKAFTGFQSGSGKKICVSESSLRSVQKLWNEGTQPDENVENLVSKANTGFQTMSGKKITVAENSLKLVQTMWEECGKSDENLCKIINPSQSSKIGVSANYAKAVPCCAVEKNLSISDKSLYPTNFENNSLVSHNMKKCNKATGNVLAQKQFGNNNEPSNIPRKDLKFKGANKYEKFSDLPTGKDIKLGEKGSLDYQKSFDDFEKMNINLVFGMPSKEEFRGNDFEQLQKEVHLEPQLFFQTASNKPVEISKGALVKAKSLWNNVNDDITVKQFYSLISTPNGVENKLVLVPASQSCNKTNERSLSPVFSSCRAKQPTCKTKFRRRTLVSEFICRSKFDKPNVNTEDESNSDTNSHQKPKFQLITGKGKSVDIQEGSLLLAKKVLNQESVNDMVMNLNEKDHSILVNREVPNFSTVIDSGNKLSDKSKGKLNVHHFLETQDFIEINKISEAFMLDNSWDDLSQSHKPFPSSRNKRNTADSDLSDNIKRKRKKTEVSSGKEYENVKKDEIVQSKSKEIVENAHGSLYQMKVYKSLSQVKLSSVNLNENAELSGQPMEKIMPHNAANWRFEMDNESYSPNGLCDRINIIPGCDCKVGVEEIEKAFLNSPVINSSLVPAKWVSNHYKWIVWKLASYQRKLDCFSQKPFSLIELIKQIRYRYDVEMLEGHRSVIRKIFEQDDLPQKTMILCVSEINNDSNKTDGHLSPMVLTDGWYSIGAQIDSSMMNLLQRKIIKVGFKLIIHGSELIGTPSPCHPLENNEAVQLKIHTNMIRIAKWHSKLGLYKFGGPIPSTNISCILDGGGHVGTLDVIVARKYPLIYMEKVGGKTIMYNERAYDKKTQDGEMLKQSLLQEIYSQVAKDLEDDETVMNDLDFINDMPNQKEIYKTISVSNDSDNLESLLLPEQLMEVHKWKQQKRNERNILIQNEVQKRFETKNKLCETVPMLKLGVVDKSEDYAIITVWRPQEGILQLLKEGKSYRIHFIAASETRNGIKQLTWNKHSRLMEISDIKTKCFTYHRKVTSLDQINSSDANNVPWSEMDVVGIVVRISEPRYGRQVAYLADHYANLLSLKFWPSIQDFGMSNVLEVGSCVSVCNASWKGKCEGTPTLHITSQTVISGSPSRQYLKEAMKNVIGAIQDTSQFLATFDSKIEETSKEVTSLSDTIRHQLSPKFKRTEIKRAKEIDGKMKELTKHYGVLSPVQTIQMKSSPLIAKPFKVPLRYGKSPSCGK